MFWLCKSDRYVEHLYVIDTERGYAQHDYIKKNLSHVGKYLHPQPINLQENLIRVCVPYRYLNGGD